MFALKPVSFAESLKSLLRQPLAWAALAAVLLFPLGLRNHTLWGNHEPYVGGIIREMTTSGRWVVPTLNGQPYLEKPPLFYALGAVGCRIFGTFQPWALRLPSALLAMGTMLWACFLGWRLGSPRAGAWAGFLVGTNALFFQMGHAAVVDMTLTAAVTLSLGLAFLAILEPEARSRWVPWFWASLGLGFLAKGLFGPVLVLLPLVIALGLWRDRDLLGAFCRPNWGMAVMAGMVGLWVVPLAWAGGRVFLEEVFIRNTLGRFSASPHLVPRTGLLGEHGEPFSFYLRRTPGNLLPWLGLWAAAMVPALPWRPGAASKAKGSFLPIVFAVDLLLLSLSKGKRMVYLLPVLPITFVHVALWLEGRVPPDEGRDPAAPALRAVLWLTVALVGILGALLPWVAVPREGLHGLLPPGLSLLSVVMTAVGVTTLRQGRPARALDLAMAQWTGFLLLFMAITIPQLDREWRPLLVPFKLAHALEAQGATVYACNLTEAQLGYASLEFQHILPSADTPEAVARALGSDRPVALLMESKYFWKENRESRGLPGVELRTEASQSGTLGGKAPALILNPGAARQCKSELSAGSNRGYPDS